MKQAKIAVIDYGFGNIKSVLNALAYCRAEGEVINSPEKILEYDGAILPGVGSFGPAADFLKSAGFDKAIHEYAGSGKMLLGICLGFQLFFTKGYENGRHQGLNLIEGEVKKFSFNDNNMKIPHMGWNKIAIADNVYAKKMFDGIDDKEDFYFVHSYYAMPENKEKVSSFCDYGIEFCSSIAYKNIWGSQFHPEKSGEKGLKILSNFINEVEK
ncbi:MAG: imidazole glycerol phosphate synthase subunit HisH [Endomicrobium sp.]|jgi:glutamine amidotransferase|nr:imidazole glycerol phosphate synthase subunit HisH [Endomicrobium sp.]